MNILLVLIPVTALIVLLAVALFFWAVNHQQFDDLDSPATLPLLDEPVEANPRPKPRRKTRRPGRCQSDAAGPARNPNRSL